MIESRKSIKGGRIQLRPITIEDSEKIIHWRNSALVKSHFILQTDFTMESQKKWMEQVIEKGKAVQFMIEVIEEGDFDIGTVYLRDLDELHKKAEYGIFIGEEFFLGKGFGTEAARLMLDFAFRELGLHKIYLQVLSDNERAIKSYEKAGFFREALLRDEVCIRGSYHDIVRMAAFHEKKINE